MPGILYLLPNQITEGDPADSLPASTLAVARSCTRFLAENAKSARSFLKAAGHPKQICELEIIEIGHEPDAAKFAEWLQPVIEGTDTAIVSESGCPAVADPGSGLVRAAAKAGITIKPLIGPCSILLTLMASGMNGQRFRFLGYLPIKDDERAETLRRIENDSRTPETQLFIETPYRNNKMLEAMTEVLAPDTLITAATDMTGSGECVTTRTALKWKEHLGSLPKLPTVFAILGSGMKKGSAPAKHRAKPSQKPVSKPAHRR